MDLVKTPVADVANGATGKEGGERRGKTLDNWEHHGVLETGYAMLCETDLVGGPDLPEMEAGKRPAWSQRVSSLDCIAVSVMKATDTPASKALEWWCFLTLDIQRSLWGDTN